MASLLVVTGRPGAGRSTVRELPKEPGAVADEVMRRVEPGTVLYRT